MPSLRRIEIRGLDEALAQLRDAPAKVRAAAGRALYQEAEAVMADSKENYVPVVTGTLRRSGFVERPKDEGGTIRVTLGYGGAAAPYAFAVHENPRSGKTGGFSPGAMSALEAAAGVGPRGGLAVGSRYHQWSRVGQWKYLEVPLVAAAGRIRTVLAEAMGRAFERS